MQAVVEIDQVGTVVGAFDSLAKHLRERPMCTVLGVNPIERLECVLVVVVHPEHEPIGFFSALQIVELLLVDLGETTTELRFAERVAGMLNPVGIRGRQLVPAIDDRREALRLTERMIVARILEQCLLHPLEGAAMVVGLVLGDLSEPVHHDDTLDRIALMLYLDLLDAE